jgi:hypothetical protein
MGENPRSHGRSRLPPAPQIENQARVAGNLSAKSRR